VIGTKGSIAAAAMSVSLLVGGAVMMPTAATTGTHAGVHSAKKVNKAAFKDESRKLWEDHIIWTRQFIVSSVADLPDAGPAAERLLRNQEDIGAFIAPFYGKAAGDQLTALLKDHILIAADILTAAKAGDSEGVAEGQQRWDDNAVEIARFLSKANPDNWPRAEMKAMLRDHLELTLTEAVARLQEDWELDIATFDDIHVQALHMADMISAGIIDQFPNRF
jgi:hypothetical protein